MKKSGKVFFTLFPRSAPPWPATLWCQVFCAIQIATSLLVCFLQRLLHHRWLLQGIISMKKTDLKRSRSSASVLSHNTHCYCAILSSSPLSAKAAPRGAVSASFNMVIQMDGSQQSGNSQALTSNPRPAVTALSESPSRQVCQQACSPFKKLSLSGGYIIIEESILQQPSLFAGLADTSLEPTTMQAWFSSPIMCSLSYDNEKNTLKLKSREAYMLLASLS